MNNQVSRKDQLVSTSLKSYLNLPAIQKRISEVIGGGSASFVTSILQIVNNSDLLKESDPVTIVNAAMMAATLKLPIHNSLGFAYIIPYKNYKTGRYEAQFQLGYKGFIQLAQRSGQFKRLVAIPVYKNQLLKKDVINGFIFDWDQEPSFGEKPVGYYAFFRLQNDFTAELFMTIDEIHAHAEKYSQTYRSHLQSKSRGKNTKSVWSDNFDAMALKTVMKLLLSKQAPLSLDMQKAVLADQSVVNDLENEDFSYPDNDANNQVINNVFNVDDKKFEQCKLNIQNGEVALQDLCDSGLEFTPEQYNELSGIENDKD